MNFKYFDISKFPFSYSKGILSCTDPLPSISLSQYARTKRDIANSLIRKSVAHNWPSYVRLLISLWQTLIRKFCVSHFDARDATSATRSYIFRAKSSLLGMENSRIVLSIQKKKSRARVTECARRSRLASRNVCFIIIILICALQPSPRSRTESLIMIFFPFAGNRMRLFANEITRNFPLGINMQIKLLLKLLFRISVYISSLITC